MPLSKNDWVWFLSLALLVLVATVFSFVEIAHAHTQWANGQPIPDWIKSSCCGPADAHHLRPDQVHDMGDYYIIDGYLNKVSKRTALPSQDGEYWIFYADYPASTQSPASQSGVYCFFVPMDF